MKNRLMLALLVTLSLVSQAGALSIREIKSRRMYKEEFEKKIKETNQVCGTSLTATYDPDTETGPRPPRRNNGNGTTFCENVLDGIQWACGHKDAQPAIAKKVKAVTCRFDRGSSNRLPAFAPELSFKNGTLGLVFDWETSNVQDKVGDYVLKIVK